MKLRKIAVFTYGMAAAFAAGAQADKFRSMDANNDGFVSRDEARAVRGFEAAFDEADDNRDGRLTPDEFIKADSIFLRQETGNYVSDTTLTAKVKTALLRERGLKSLDVNVETYRGRVLLSGWVDSEDQRRIALNTARHVDGVTEVRDGMNVR
jgi:hyperosmotically inducible periplasmic protein